MGMKRKGEMNRAVVTTVASFAAYVAAIVAANAMIVHGFFGLATATPFHTYTLPVGFGLVAPAGTYMAALSWPLRDVTQRSGGRIIGIAAILVAAVVSWWVSNPTIAVASGGTFLISESFDFLVYTPLQKRWFVPAVIASGVVASVVDSLIFLKWAGIPYSGNLEGIIVGKLWIVVLVGGSLAYGLRKVLPTKDPVLA
jgi:uncharacterized PurR-regulated membrane protein YhhQ (DUF165 family)